MPVFMCGIDATDWERVQRMILEGKLPVLAQLMRQGCYGRLDSPADEYAGGVWPDFYTGQPVSHHGIYHNKLWRARHMRCEIPTDRWLTARPFYETLSEQGYRVCVLDMPMVLGTPRELNGIYLGGWGTHDLIAKGATPDGLWKKLQSNYGSPAMPAEYFGRQSAQSLTDLYKRLLHATEQMAAIGFDLLGSEKWDFGCVILGAAHRAGHYLWDDSQLENASQSERDKLNSALDEVYMACDQALGKLLAAIPDRSLKIAFAVHGMKANHGWGDLGHDLLEEVFRSSRQQKPKRGLLYQLRRRLPFHLVRPLLTRLPAVVTDRLVELWSARMYDWPTTPYFPLPMDQSGYIRINLKGREKHGIVEHGAEYDKLCDELEQNLLSLKDADSGKTIVSSVVRAWSDAPETAAARDVLPDLVVIWGELPAGQCRRVLSDRLPDFAFTVPEYNASGRSGNHTDHGWFIADGPDLVSRGRIDGYTVRDLAPSVFNAMGIKPPEYFESHVSIWQREKAGDN